MKYVDPSGNKWTDTTTTIITFSDNSIRTYSARNSDARELKGILNVFENAKAQEMKVIKFTSEVDIPNALQRLIAKTFGIKLWDTKPRNIELIESYGHEIGDIEYYNMTNLNESDLAVDFANLILGSQGISDIDFADNLITTLLGSHPVSKITSIALKGFGIGRDIHGTVKLIEEKQSDLDKQGLFYLDQVFLLDPLYAEDYLYAFEEPGIGIGKPINQVSLEEAVCGMVETVPYFTNSHLRYKYILHQMNEAKDLIAKITIKMFSIAFGIKGL